ncbi:MAG: UDP-N-acetylmuramoyl-tripeptide--D-alanyl-D-alanine ligase [Prolixibacteraceae bacterium]|nr:UDP-N-acetylmuramoyl-tripeptide--D-alanyl-D-alanine ligase [Prolixibacteraceae bacterium]
MDIEKIYELYIQSGRVFTDSREAKPGGIFVALKGDRFDGNAFAHEALRNGADFALVDDQKLAGNPGCILVENSLTALQELANYHRRKLKITVLAITGTNGKTTTKELIAAVLSQKYNVLATSGNLNNHIGVPLTLLSVNSSHDIAVVEMGANHPGEISQLCKIAEPDYGLITNVGNAHIEGFGSFEGVKRTKAELYNFISKKGKGIFINIGNKHLNQMASGELLKYSYGTVSSQLYGEAAGNGMYLVCKIFFPGEWLYVSTNLIGEYNLENALAAARVGLQFGVDQLLIKKAIEDYQPANNRSQLVEIGTNKLIVDCYNANPTSMEAAINNFIKLKANNKVLVLGDMLELGATSGEEHQRIADRLRGQSNVDVYLVGDEFSKTDTPVVFQKFRSVEELSGSIKISLWNDKSILIKGSRGMKLERFIEAIKKPA